MREMTSRERRLGTLFGLAIFILLNMMLLVFLKGQRAILQQRAAKLKNQQMEANSLLNDKEFWDARAQWLKENKPTYALTGDAQTELLEMLQKTPGEHGITATPPVLDDPKDLGGYQEVSAQTKITGSLKPVISWLAQVQQPGKFQSIVNFQLKADKEPGNVICELRVAKWFFVGPPPAPAEGSSAASSGNYRSPLSNTVAPGVIMHRPPADQP